MSLHNIWMMTVMIIMMINVDQILYIAFITYQLVIVTLRGYSTKLAGTNAEFLCYLQIVS